MGHGEHREIKAFGNTVAGYIFNLSISKFFKRKKYTLEDFNKFSFQTHFETVEIVLRIQHSK